MPLFAAFPTSLHKVFSGQTDEKNIIIWREVYIMLHYYRFKDALSLFSAGKLEEGRRILRELLSEYISMADELNALRAQVQEYEDILYLARNLIFDGSYYWLLTGSLRQGPFCPHCYAKNGLLVRLLGEDGVFRCPNCLRDMRIPKKEETAPNAEAVQTHAKIIPFGH